MMQHHLVSPVRARDAAHVAVNMRQADIDEVRAASGLDPLTALMLGMELSEEVYTLRTPSGAPAAIFGVTRLSPSVGGIWLLGTDDIVRHALSFHRGIRPHLDAINARYGVLGNMVDARNTVHIRWLRWLGFEFGEPIIAGVELRPFLPFKRTIHHV